MTDIEELKELKEQTKILGNKIDAIDRLLYKGDDLALPINLLSSTIQDIKQIVSKHTSGLESLHNRISRITEEEVRSRNQIKYMFLVLLLTALGKFLFNVPYIQYLVGK